MIVLEIIGAAAVLEIGMQVAWYLGLRRLWRPDPPKPLQCDELVKYTTQGVGRCRLDLNHHGPREHTRSGFETHYWHTTPRKDSAA